MNKRAIWINNTRYIMKPVNCNCYSISFDGRKFKRITRFGMCTACATKAFNEYASKMAKS